MFAVFEFDRIKALRVLGAVTAALWHDGWYFASKHCDAACLCWAVMWKQVSEVKQNCRRESKTQLCCGCKQKLVLLDVHWDHREPAGLFLVAFNLWVGARVVLGRAGCCSSMAWCSPAAGLTGSSEAPSAGKKAAEPGWTVQKSDTFTIWLLRNHKSLLLNSYWLIGWLVNWLLLWPEFFLKFASLCPKHLFATNCCSSHGESTTTDQILPFTVHILYVCDQSSVFPKCLSSFHQ